MDEWLVSLSLGIRKQVLTLDSCTEKKSLYVCLISDSGAPVHTGCQIIGQLFILLRIFEGAWAFA